MKHGMRAPQVVKKIEAIDATKARSAENMLIAILLDYVPVSIRTAYEDKYDEIKGIR